MIGSVSYTGLDLADARQTLDLSVHFSLVVSATFAAVTCAGYVDWFRHLRGKDFAGQIRLPSKRTFPFLSPLS